MSWRSLGHVPLAFAVLLLVIPEDSGGDAEDGGSGTCARSRRGATAPLGAAPKEFEAVGAAGKRETEIVT